MFSKNPDTKESVVQSKRSTKMSNMDLQNATISVNQPTESQQKSDFAVDIDPQLLSKGQISNGKSNIELKTILDKPGEVKNDGIAAVKSLLPKSGTLKSSTSCGDYIDHFDQWSYLWLTLTVVSLALGIAFTVIGLASGKISITEVGGTILGGLSFVIFLVGIIREWHKDNELKKMLNEIWDKCEADEKKIKELEIELQKFWNDKPQKNNRIIEFRDLLATHKEKINGQKVGINQLMIENKQNFKGLKEGAEKSYDLQKSIDKELSKINDDIKTIKATLEDHEKRITNLEEEKHRDEILNIDIKERPFFKEDLFVASKCVDQKDGKKYLSLLHERLKDEKEIAICGLGGLGKTQLALAYAYRYEKDYNVNYWIDTAGGDKEDSIELKREEEVKLPSQRDNQINIIYAYKSLLKQLSPQEETTIDEQSPEKVVRSLKYWLPQKTERWLLVYDNVENPEQLKDVRLDALKNGHVIITSRCQTWNNCLELKPFQIEESVNYLFNYLSKTVSDNPCAKRTDENRDSAKKVATTLGNLPLALAQAVSYIKQEKIGFEQYLKDLGCKAPELLNQALIEDKYKSKKEGLYKKAVATTWQITLDKIAIKNPLTKIVMDRIAYLAPDDIPIEVLCEENSSEENEAAVNNAVNLLNDYTMLSKHSKKISVHRLVQQIIREPSIRQYVAENENRGEKAIIPDHISTLQFVLKKLVNLFTKDTRLVEKNHFNNVLLPHVDVVCANAKHFLETDYHIKFQVARLLNVKAFFYTQIGMVSQGAETISMKAKSYCEELAGITQEESQCWQLINQNNNKEKITNEKGEEDKINENNLASSTKRTAKQLYQRLVNSSLSESDKALLPTVYASILYTYGRMCFYPGMEHKKKELKYKAYLYMSKWLSQLIREKIGKKIFYEILAVRNGLLYFCNQEGSEEATLLQGIDQYETLLQDINTYTNEEDQQIVLKNDKSHQMICHRQIVSICAKLSRWQRRMALEKGMQHVKLMEKIWQEQGDKASKWERIAVDYNVIGKFYLECGQYNNAWEYFEKAKNVEIAKNAGKGKQDYPLAEAYEGLAEASLRIKQYAEMEGVYVDRKCEAETYTGLARLCYEKGDLSKAQKFLEEAKSVYEAMQLAMPGACLESIEKQLQQIKQQTKSISNKTISIAEVKYSLSSPGAKQFPSDLSIGVEEKVEQPVAQIKIS